MRYEEQLQLPFFLANESGNLSLTNLVNVIQMVSERQLDALGEGVSGLAEYNAGWVITQSQITITRLPRAEELVTVWTEATSYNRLMCYRDYGIDDADGNELARVTSTWVMMDLTKRKIVPIIEDAVQGVGAVKAPHVKRLPRVSKIDKVAGSNDYRVRYFDIDANHHVNNVHYFEWMLDALGADWLQSHMPVAVNIKYSREVDRGGMVTAEYAGQDEGLTTLHRIVSEGEVNAEAVIEWRLVEQPGK